MRRFGRGCGVLVAAALVLLAAPSGAAAPERGRSVTERYTTTATPGLTCETNENGVCLDLAGDELSVRLAVQDDEGWTDLPLQYEFADGTGTVLSSGEGCARVDSAVPAGSRVLRVTVALVTAGTCSHPTVTQSGTVTATYALRKTVNRTPADEERQCTGGLGEPLSYVLRPDDGRRVAVDALILVDGVSLEAAQALMAKVVRGYAAVAIDIRPTFQEVALTPTSLDVDPIFDAMKATVGGEVPAGQELVHLLTSKDIIGWGGYADCVGGIQTRTQAFSMSELRNATINIIRGVPAPVWPWGEDYLAAHEIGHLFGGGHDLANCAEGVTVVEGEVPAPCTLMHPNLNISMKFSTINRAVVRGHALDFASP